MKKWGNKRRLSLDEVAEMFNVNVWTIRLWINRLDSIKLYRDKSGNLFLTPKDADKIGTICRLAKEKEKTFADIREYIEPDVPNE